MDTLHLSRSLSLSLSLFLYIYIASPSTPSSLPLALPFLSISLCAYVRVNMSSAVLPAETWRKPSASTSSEEDDTHLDLSLGMSLGSSKSAKDHCMGHDRTNNSATAMDVVFSGSPAVSQWPGVSGGVTGWLNDATFVHPWSLAARQEKGVLERVPLREAMGNGQAAAGASSPPLSLPAGTRVHQTTPVIGWPPVRSHRKNILSIHPSKSSDEDDTGGEEKEAKKSKPSEIDDVSHKQEEKKPAKFVKVNIEGFVVGRKIDLMAEDGYESLSCTLCRMFNNFLSVGKAGKGMETNDEFVGTRLSKLTLLYEDNEGDRMLVGDVPWEMFMASVKRLYISCRLKANNQGEDDDLRRRE